jgi:hypothetical protein
MEAGGIQEYQHRSRLALLKAIEQILVFSFFHAIGPLGLRAIRDRGSTFSSYLSPVFINWNGGGKSSTWTPAAYNFRFVCQPPAIHQVT